MQSQRDLVGASGLHLAALVVGWGTMAGDDDKPNLDELREKLREPLSAALEIEAGLCHVDYLCEPKDVADDPTKLLVRDPDSHKVAVVLVSSPVDPDIVGRGMRIAAEAKKVLGERLGRVILDPLGEGTLRGLSYTILPFRKPMSEGRITRRYWRLVLRGRVLDWLCKVNEATALQVDDADLAEAFERPLEHLATLDTMDDALRRGAGEALQSLNRGDWSPSFVLMHGDLWKENLLLASRTPRLGRGESAPFIVIDWPGATLRGYAMYDLLRLARSMNLSRSGLAREVLRHCEILGITPTGAMGYLLASLGHLGMNLGCFASEKYTEVSVACFNDLRRALA
jgi:hypothetical protein